MTLLILIIFVISTILSFGIVSFRVWEMRTGRIEIPNYKISYKDNLSFRHLEKNMLYLIKHIIQSIVILLAKVWFVSKKKVKLWFSDKLPKINKYFKIKESQTPKRHSFLKRAILESKAKIKKIKESVEE